MKFPMSRSRSALFALLLAATCDPSGAAPATEAPASASRLSWRETGASLALLREGRVVWQFNHLRDGSERGCPYFHPLATLDGAVLTDLRPDDHRWHRGLRFAWKKINGLDGYWTWPEGLDRWPDDTGQTEVTAARVIPGTDFSARFELELSYHPPGKTADLTEKRTIRVSAPDREGSYRIDWHGVFTAGERGAVLDRTPIPGETDGKRWGGYAGLQLRLPPRVQLSRWALLNSENISVANEIGSTGGLERVHGRKARWLQVTLDFVDGRTASAALFDHPGNLRHPVVWHAISMSNELIQTPLYHGPHTLQAGETLTFRYRIVVRPGRAETARLEDEWKQFSQIGNP